MKLSGNIHLTRKISFQFGHISWIVLMSLGNSSWHDNFARSDRNSMKFLGNIRFTSKIISLQLGHISWIIIELCNNRWRLCVMEMCEITYLFMGVEGRYSYGQRDFLKALRWRPLLPLVTSACSTTHLKIGMKLVWK